MRTLAITKKVIKELLRDKRTLAMMFVAPAFYHVVDEPYVFS